MPWQGVTSVDLRLQLVTEYLDEIGSMTELCAQYRVSRKTAYKWVARHEAWGTAGLCDRSRRPHRAPRALDDAVRRALIAARARHPTWGARKLLAWLQRRQPATAWPARSTVCDLLKREGLVAPRATPPRQRPAPPAPLRASTQANEVWTVDYKGQFLTGDGAWCYPLTIRDAFSRYLLRCDALAGPLLAPTRASLARAFATYGLPERIRSDNGSPFASSGLGRLSQLAVWWMRLGIVPERIAPAHPEQNGSHEQFHAVLKRETTRPPAATRAAQHQRFVRFRREYNEDRPHEALADQPPATCYTRSPRPLPRRLPPLEYPGHWQVRRVSHMGQISWGGSALFVSSALAGDHVALDEIDEGLWTLYFAATPLARLDDRTRRLRPLPAR